MKGWLGVLVLVFAGPVQALPGHVLGILRQDGPHGPLRFSSDQISVPNVYVENRTGPAQDFQIDGKGTKIALPHGFRALKASDLGTACALVDLEVNHGQGMTGLNGMVVGHWRRVFDLSPRLADLEAQVDHFSAVNQARIRPFFHQSRQGHDEHQTLVVWHSGARNLSVHCTRAVVGRRPAAVPVHGRGARFLLWRVPYLEVDFRLDPKGRLLEGHITPPGDPLTTARRSNPGGSPWDN